MARLPTVGGDYGNWGTVLNEYLATAHNADGTLKLDVQTIADLKAIDVATLTDRQQALVAGYYAPGDGGGGAFYYDAGASTADNGGTIIAPTAGSGRWMRVYSGPVNVRWFGAKGDGAAFSAAISSGSARLTASSAVFSAGDVGRSVCVIGGSGSLHLITTVAAFVSPTEVDLAANAGATGTRDSIIVRSDDLAPIQSAINTTSEVFVPTGVYYISSELVPASNGVLRITGVNASDAVIVRNGSASSKVIKHVTDGDRFFLGNLGFAFSEYGLYYKTSTSVIDTIYVSDCRFFGFTKVAIFAASVVRKVDIRSSTFEDIRSSASYAVGVLVGNNIGDQIGGNTVVEGCDFRRITCTQASGAEIHGVQLYGTEGRVINNTFNDIYRDDAGRAYGDEGLYVKFLYGVISHNFLNNAGFGQAPITVKGYYYSQGTPGASSSPRGYGVRVFANTIRGNDASRAADAGVQINSDWADISHNIIEGRPGQAGIRCDDVIGLTVKANRFVDFGGQYGIYAKAVDGAVHIEGNDMHNFLSNAAYGSMYGIFVSPYSATGSAVFVSDNRVSLATVPANTGTRHGIYIIANGADEIYHAAVRGNFIDIDRGAGTKYGVYVYLDAATTASIDNLVVEANVVPGMVTSPLFYNLLNGAAIGARRVFNNSWQSAGTTGQVLTVQADGSMLPV